MIRSARLLSFTLSYGDRVFGIDNVPKRRGNEHTDGPPWFGRSALSAILHRARSPILVARVAVSCVIGGADGALVVQPAFRQAVGLSARLPRAEPAAWGAA